MITQDVVWSEDFDEDLIGRTLEGKYELRRVIGEGGMGRIYLAHQDGMDRYVAVKVLHPSFAEDTRAVTRFLREVKAASRLNHPNTIRIYDFGKAHKLLFMVLEVLKGRSLADIIDGDGPLPTRRAVKVAIQICDSLAEAHQQGVIHRDLKPDNIHIEKMFGNPDHVKVLDFGIAKLQYGDRPTGRDARTDPNVICGTPSYMSPEQIDGRAPVDARSDVYGLGILMYEMLTGHPPFWADVPFDVLLMQLNESPPPLTTGENLPPSLSELIGRMLAKDPGERPEDCQAVRSELEAIADYLDARAAKMHAASKKQTILFGSGNLSSSGLEGPQPKKRLSSERRHTPTAAYEALRREEGTTVARNRSTPMPGQVALQAGSPAAGQRVRQMTPIPKTEGSRRIDTGPMKAAAARSGAAGPKTPEPFPARLTSGEQVVAQMMDDLSPRKRMRTPTSRRIDASTLQRHGDIKRQPKPRKVDLPMQPTRVALLHVESGDKFDLIASNELYGVVHCLHGAGPAVGTKLTLAGAETRFAHVQAVVEVLGAAPDVPAPGFLQIRWHDVTVGQKASHMALALDALLSVNPDAVKGWPSEDELEPGTRLSYVPPSGKLTLERAKRPQVSLAERARRPSRKRLEAALDPPSKK